MKRLTLGRSKSEAFIPNHCDSEIELKTCVETGQENKRVLFIIIVVIVVGGGNGGGVVVWTNDKCFIFLKDFWLIQQAICKQIPIFMARLSYNSIARPTNAS